uniref:Lipoyl-binding domain-containing protein n=1 Tax=Brassica oleracea TaxID=3712 RepID=A0A3P6DAT5_BRAOL|nr:unnamed protein product [Brassica oleracea]
MASSPFSLTSPAASVYGATQTSSQLPLPTTRSRLPRRVSFRLSAKPKLRFLSKPSRSSYPVVKAQSNQVGGGASSNASAPAKLDEPSAKEKNASSSSSADLATEESISEFLTQVTTLVKLVDSRDIVELQLKQLDCELVIRKKEALPQPPQSPAPYVMMQQPNQPSYVQSAPPPPAPTAASPAPSSTPASSPPPSPPSPAKSSLPTVKSPMAGTFYRSPGPGEPSFIKVGDKVQKGQVLCIVEAMKLMNEIESDQTGTVVDIVAEDGKPVSLDTETSTEQPLSSPMSTPRDLSFLITALFSSTIFLQLYSLPDPSFYDYLRESGLPAGIVPKGVTNFSIDVKTGRFTVALPVPCDAKFESQFHFDYNITGVLSDGRIGNLSGVTQKELFLWFAVKGIHVDPESSGLIHFDVGVADKQMSLSLFESPRDCTAAVYEHRIIFVPPRNRWRVSS